MKRHLIYIIIVALTAGSKAVHAQGKSFSESISPSATIQTVVGFTLTSNSSPTITFNSGSDYISGYSVSNFSTIAIKANVNWNFYISSATANFSNSGSYSTPNTPASILEYNIEGKSTKIALSNTAKLLSSGTPGDASETGHTFNISFAAKPGYNYGPGTYTISTVYTLSAQ